MLEPVGRLTLCPKAIARMHSEQAPLPNLHGLHCKVEAHVLRSGVCCTVRIGYSDTQASSNVSTRSLHVVTSASHDFQWIASC